MEQTLYQKHFPSISSDCHSKPFARKYLKLVANLASLLLHILNHFAIWLSAALMHKSDLPKKHVDFVQICAVNGIKWIFTEYYSVSKFKTALLATNDQLIWCSVNIIY